MDNTFGQKKKKFYSLEIILFNAANIVNMIKKVICVMTIPHEDDKSLKSTFDGNNKNLSP